MLVSVLESRSIGVRINSCLSTAITEVILVISADTWSALKHLMTDSV